MIIREDHIGSEAVISSNDIAIHMDPPAKPFHLAMQSNSAVPFHPE